MNISSLNLKSLLFGFGGRVPRSIYWAHYLIILLICALLMLLTSLFKKDGGVSFPFLMIMVFPWIWIHLAVTVKRFHDMNRTGWWVLLDMIPYLGTAAVVVLCGFFSGTKDANKFGQPMRFKK